MIPARSRREVVIIYPEIYRLFKTSICSGKTPGGSCASVVGSPTEEFQSPNVEHPLNGHYYVENPYTKVWLGGVS